MFATLTYSTANPHLFSPGHLSPSSHKPTRNNNSTVSLRAFARPSVAPPLETKRRQYTSLYDVLQLDYNASQAQIKSAYRRLAKIYHPDSSNSDSHDTHFINIHNAYVTLSDPSAKSIYDFSLTRPPARGFGQSFGSRYNSAFYSTRKWETDQCW